MAVGEGTGQWADGCGAGEDASEYGGQADGVSVEQPGEPVDVSGDECGLVLYHRDGGILLGL